MSRPNRPIEGETIRTKVGCGYIYMTNNLKDEYPEVFLRLGKPGGCPRAFLQALGMAISLGSRAGVTKEDFIKAFKDISCPSPMWDGPKHNLSCLDAIAKMLEESN